jgi:transcriptional regulator GlxA family with amidase domain
MLDFTILVLPQAYAASVSITLDVLRSAHLLAERQRLPRPTWRVVSPEGGSVTLSSGLELNTRRMPLRHGRDHSVWVVPGLGIDHPSAVSARLSSEQAVHTAQAIAKHVASGGEAAASCSAVFLLQAAGLLQGKRATTTWWLANELQRLEPSCRVDANRMVVHDGAITTAGAALAQADMMLSLLRKRFGGPTAELVGKVMLLDGRQAQSPYIIPSLQAAGNTLIARLTQRIESALPRVPSVAALASEFAMSQRTFARKVQAATGKGPLALIQSVRWSRARTLIEGSRLTLDQIAEQVGYEDATALRRLIQKSSGVNPSRFRSTT